MYNFNDVTLLITHYNRNNSLERLLKSFKDLDCTFNDIVVSDDGSKPEHLEKIKEFQEHYKFRLITAETNKGLGNNINKGQDAVNTPFTLYVQEDFIPQALFPEKLNISLEILRKEERLDVVRYYAYFRYPHLKKYVDNFYEMIFSPWAWYQGYKKFYYYSDHPHLRRTSFFSKFGRYPEGIKVEATEYRMMMSFLKNKGKALFYYDYNDLFVQSNSSEEPSTVKRNYWRDSPNLFVLVAKHTYRLIKFNMDYFSQKKF